jgi:hypothetical protein
MKAAAMRKVHAETSSNTQRFKGRTPAELSTERYQQDLKHSLTRQENERRQQAALAAGRPLVPVQLSQSQLAAAAAAAAAQRRVAMANGQTAPQQQSATPQNSQATRVPSTMQNGVVNGIGMSGMTQAQQLQALQNLRMGQQNSTDSAQLAALQQRQLQQMAAGGQLPSQTANLVAAHLSPSAGGMQNPQQQQILLAMQRASMNGVHGMNGMGAMGTSPTSSGNSAVNNALLSYMNRISHANPHWTAEQVRRIAVDSLRRGMSQNALSLASGASSTANMGLQGLQGQQAALAAQQQIGLQQANTQMMAAAYAHGHQNALGPMVSPAQGLAAAMSQQSLPSNAAHSPTQMYRPMSAQAQVAAAHQRMPSGSPGLVPARPDSRGGAGTPVGMASGMVRSMSGTASQSPILGGTPTPMGAQGLSGMAGAGR